MKRLLTTFLAMIIVAGMTAVDTTAADGEDVGIPAAKEKKEKREKTDKLLISL